MGLSTTEGTIDLSCALITDASKPVVFPIASGKLSNLTKLELIEQARPIGSELRKIQSQCDEEAKK
jgi:hypothetical protein